MTRVPGESIRLATLPNLRDLGRWQAADGRTVLATNVQKNVGGQTLYFRRYPTGPLFANVVGYSTQSRNRTGIEQSYNDFLTGSNANLDTVFRSTVDKLKGSTITGNNIVLTIRPGLQALAHRLLQGKCGAVVARGRTCRAGQRCSTAPRSASTSPARRSR